MPLTIRSSVSSVVKWRELHPVRFLQNQDMGFPVLRGIMGSLVKMDSLRRVARMVARDFKVIANDANLPVL